MVNFSSITSFSDATYALKKLSGRLRLSLRYSAGAGTAYGHLVAKVTNNSTTLTFSTDSKADLKELDALALWLMMAHVQPDSAASGEVEKAAETTAETVLPRAPRIHPEGSGAQRRAAARARAAASGITKPLSTKAKFKLRKLENRTERRRLRATTVASPRTLVKEK